MTTTEMPNTKMRRRIEVIIGIEEEYVDRLMNAFAELEGWSTADDKSPAECLELAIKRYVRELEKDIERERHWTEAYANDGDADVPF